MVEPNPSEDYAALEQLPASIRKVLNETGANISPISILKAYRAGYSADFIVQQIHQGDEDMAVDQGTMPGEFWRGRRIHLTPPAEKRQTAAVAADPRFRGRTGRPRPRRLSRGPGSY